MLSPSDLDAVRITLDPASQASLPYLLATMAFAVALNLRPEHFSEILKAPNRFVGASMVQIFGLPAITIVLALVLQPPPSVALGMIVVACCPGGQVSNLFTHLARGDAAFSIALTAVSSVWAALFLPLMILGAATIYGPTRALLETIEFSAAAFLVQTSLILVAPAIAGMVLAARAPRLADALKPWVTGAGLGGLILVATLGTIKYWSLLSGVLVIIGPVVLAHNLAAYGLGWSGGAALRLAAPRRRAMMFEVGQQNTGLGLVLLLTQLDGLGGAAVVTAVWGVWHLIAGLALVAVFRGLFGPRRADQQPDARAQ